MIMLGQANNMNAFLMVISNIMNNFLLSKEKKREEKKKKEIKQSTTEKYLKWYKPMSLPSKLGTSQQNHHGRYYGSNVIAKRVF